MKGRDLLSSRSFGVNWAQCGQVGIVGTAVVKSHQHV